MTRVGEVGSFDELKEDFDSYMERVQIYFLANSIEEKLHVCSFLSLAGSKIYALAKSLLSPKILMECSLQEITEALSHHYKPKRILIYERYLFYQRNQKTGESISEYVAALKEAARNCDFGKTLEEMLRDRLVMGLSDAATQRNLLTVDTLTFKAAMDYAIAQEAAYRDASIIARTTEVSP
eukprot:TRINITY_DN2783_c0_g1_i5.p1 TRINITY_DN2783_c0_g1~~TRINITY_DN2783_c0_g1_i5.p1  ORF type:complete len:181 (-),score=1.19 TRINITY_DN2783_c0_g1_i5:600-1142(-)